MSGFSKFTLLGSYSQTPTRLVDDRELDNPAFLRDFKNFAAGLSLSPGRWVDYLSNEYMHFPGTIIHQGKQVSLDLEVFEVPEDDLFNTNDNPVTDHDAEVIHERLRNWFKEFCRPCPAHVTPHVRKEARERVRVMATILRARNPKAAMLWGRMDAVNDNDPA